MKKVLAAYWPSIRKYPLLLCLTTIGLVVGTTLDAIHPYFIRALVDVFTAKSPDAADAKSIFVWLIALTIGVRAAWSAFHYAISLFECRVMTDLDERSFAMLQAQAMRFFENSFSGSLVKQVTRFRYAFEGLADAFFHQLAKDVILIMLIFGIFFSELPDIAWIFLIWVALFIIMNIVLSIWKYPLDMVSAKSDSRVSGALADSLTNHATVKSYGMEALEQQRFDAVAEDNFRKRKKSWIVGEHLHLLQAMVMGVFELLLIWMLIKGWEKGTVSAGDFVFFQSFILWLFMNLWDLGHVLRRTFQHCADAQEMADVYNLIPEIRDIKGAKELDINKGEIKFDHISFSYVGQKHHPLRHDIQDLSLTINAGDSIAFVGKSGSGKTTLIKLLMRYFDLQGGKIVIDGQNVADVMQESLRQRIALVPQQPELFHRTLFDNIAFARPGATQDEVIVAAKRARAWEFIQKMPEGLQTIVGERGVKLSGGERQRIALARAFLVDAPILILDEATSALDSETEHQIQKAIEDLLRDRTSIVIAHRLSTINQMNRIVVLEEGEIKEEGTHKSLVDKHGVYARLWAYQSGGYIE